MIGIFDSGVGGLSVLKEIRRLLPDDDLTYLADQANAPYGSRSLSEVRRLAEQCTRHLIDRGAELIVIACNTASAAALHHLRDLYPMVPFVGMEPAVKPAAALTRSGVIGVLATGATFQGELFASLVDRFGDGFTIVPKACPGWADLVEKGETTGPRVTALVATHLDPVLAAGADTLVLGCTHYPFLHAVISDRAGSQVSILDPALAVARQVAAQRGLRPRSHGSLEVYTTGHASSTARVIKVLTEIEWPVLPVTWT
jgi:glutamate racemase